MYEPFSTNATGGVLYGDDQTVSVSCAASKAPYFNVDINTFGRARPNTERLDCSGYPDSGCKQTAAGLTTLVIDNTTGAVVYSFIAQKYNLSVSTPGSRQPNGESLSGAQASVAFRLLLAGVGLDAQGNPITTPTQSLSAPPPVDATSPAVPEASPAAGLGGSEDIAGNDGNTYTVTNWGDSTITSCSTHAYGAIVAFLQSHPCTDARRRLVSLQYDGGSNDFTAVSMIRVRLTSDSTASLFADEENANGTGGMDDLLREGVRIYVSGAPTQIPSTEAFVVNREDATVWIYDAFYIGGTTSDQDPSLLALVAALYRTSFDSNDSTGPALSPSSSVIGSAAALRACQLWRAQAKNIAVSDAVRDSFTAPAAAVARAGGSHWSGLARAMETLTDLPNTGLTESQLAAAKLASTAITQNCAILGIKA